MDGLFRRPSGYYCARLAVPSRLRAAVGKTEMIASTGVRDLAVARIVAGHQLATWRRRFLELERLLMGTDIDVLLALTGSPALAGPGYLPLHEAAAASGLGQDTLLREVVGGRMELHYQALSVRGYLVPYAALERNFDPHAAGESGYIVPLPHGMPTVARELRFTGILTFSEPIETAGAFLADEEFVAVLFDDPGSPGHAFAPDTPLSLTRSDVVVSAGGVDVARRRVAALVTPDQLDEAKAARPIKTVDVHPNRLRPLRESLAPFLSDNKRQRRAEQVERVRSACELFLELMGHELRGTDLTRDMVRRFRDIELARVPANENKVRLTHGSRSVTESIAAVVGLGWPTMSSAQQVKRIGWVAGWIDWLGREGWADADVAEGLVGGGEAGRSNSTARHARRKRDKRDAFTEDELRLIFQAPWFLTGAGDLTEKGTYRTWSPVRTWLPLLGLLTGARIGELAQLHLTDIWSNESGVWLIDINDGTVDAVVATKRLKNAQSRRQIPVHPELIRIGLIKWRDRLQLAGHQRLFPELHFDETKGYGKAATKWFSGYLKSIGLPRTLRKVFHSFRHNVASTLTNSGVVPQVVVSQILGHESGSSTTVSTYRKDVKLTDEESALVRAIRSLEHDFLRSIVPMNVDAGLVAVRDALSRKNGGLGANED